jgi:hypothetical protein
MLGFVTPVGANARDPLADVPAADAFWRMLPRSDAIESQKAVCGALADLVARDKPSMSGLRAVLALDRHARKLIDSLLIHYHAADPRPPELEKPYWQAAFELCGSFGEAHGYFLRCMRTRVLFQGWRDYLPFVALRLFQHRQMELLLRPFADDRFAPISWKDVHEVYRFVGSRKLLHDPLPVYRCHSREKAETTLEREYIQVLLQNLINDAQFPPYDAFWVSQNLPRWCHALALQPHRTRAGDERFAVDVSGDAGLARSSTEAAGTRLCLDTIPLLESIREELAGLRDAPEPSGDGSAPARGRQVKVLRKMSVLCAPKRPVIVRRGERKPAAATVEVVSGITEILRALRDTGRDAVAAAPADVPEIEEITITAVSEFTEPPVTMMSIGGLADPTTVGLAGGASTVTQWSMSAGDLKHSSMKLMDRSESGCRLHGQMFGTNRVMPGTLIAYREDAAFPWTLAVVRRVDRLAGGRIELGAEYVGTDPRGVVITLAPDSQTVPAGATDRAGARFAALYLPESVKRPTLPIKTLILPARRFAAADQLMLWSAPAVFTIRLKEPLEEQSGFVWSPFEIVDRRPRGEPVGVDATSGIP